MNKVLIILIFFALHICPLTLQASCDDSYTAISDIDQIRQNLNSVFPFPNYPEMRVRVLSEPTPKIVRKLFKSPFPDDRIAAIKASHVLPADQQEALLTKGMTPRSNLGFLMGGRIRTHAEILTSIEAYLNSPLAMKTPPNPRVVREMGWAIGTANRTLARKAIKLLKRRDDVLSLAAFRFALEEILASNWDDYGRDWKDRLVEMKIELLEVLEGRTDFEHLELLDYILELSLTGPYSNVVFPFDWKALKLLRAAKTVSPEMNRRVIQMTKRGYRNVEVHDGPGTWNDAIKSKLYFKPEFYSELLEPNPTMN